MDQSNTAQANSKLKKETAKEAKASSDEQQAGSEGKSIPAVTPVAGQTKMSVESMAKTSDSASSVAPSKQKRT